MVVNFVGRSILIGIIADLAVLAIFWYILRRLKDEKISLNGLLKTRDGYYSLANFQFFVWTLVFIFSLTTIKFVRLFNGNFNPIEDIPQQLLLLMGLSVAVTPISGAISEIKYPEKREDTEKDDKSKSFAGMLMEGGMPSITRYQMFAWTLISASIYLFVVYTTLFDKNLDITNLKLPDVDATLVFLMGLSQAGYIGGKLVTPGEIKITYVSPPKGEPGQKISIMGFDFGDLKGSVELDDKSASVEEWTRTRIDVKIPVMNPDTYDFKVIAGGRPTKPFRFEVLKKTDT